MREKLEQKLEEMREYSVLLQEDGEKLVARAFDENKSNAFSLQDYSCIIAGNILFYLGVFGETFSGSLVHKMYKQR